jgi:hypothetical protein
MKRMKIKLIAFSFQFFLVFGFLLLVDLNLSTAAGIYSEGCKGEISYKKGPGSSRQNKFCERHRQVQLFSTSSLYLKKNAAVTLICPGKDKRTGQDQSISKKYTNPSVAEVEVNVGKFCKNINPGKGDFAIRIGGNDSRVPYIISPRTSKLLTDRPIIRWNSIKDNEGSLMTGITYTIELYKVGQEQPIGTIKHPAKSIDKLTKLFCKTQDKECQKGRFNYEELTQEEMNDLYKSSQTSVTLEENVSYRLVVTADNCTKNDKIQQEPSLCSSKKDIRKDINGHSYDLVFKRIVLKTPDEINSSEDGTKVRYFLEKELYLEALKVLEITQDRTPQTYIDLGIIYDEMGLNLWGEGAYRKAIAMSNYPKRPVWEAQAKDKLGKLLLARSESLSQGNKISREFIKEARILLQDAAVLYKQQEMEDSLRQVNDLLEGNPLPPAS